MEPVGKCKGRQSFNSQTCSSEIRQMKKIAMGRSPKVTKNPGAARGLAKGTSGFKR